MDISNTFSDKIIPIPQWDNVRMLYKKLSDEFHILTDSYAIEISGEKTRNLDHLIIVIDDVDRCVDELPEQSSRNSITESLIGYLESGDEKWFHPDASDLLMKQVYILKIIIFKEGIHEPFILAARKIFSVTEIKRHTTDMDLLINYIKEEGAATALLPLSILGVNPKEPFGIFFSRLCMIMGIADLVFDAREDFKNGYIKVRPSIKLYARLNIIVMIEGLKLFFSFPKKMSFLVYCYKFLIALVRE